MKQSIAAALLAALAATIPLRAEILEQVLVKVNGEIITKTEFEARQVAELRNRPELAKASPASLELQKAIAEVTPDLILSAVDELLLVQRGRESGYTLGDQQFNQIVDNIKKSNNLEDEARFKEALKQEGLTMEDLRRNLERQMLVSQVQRVEIMEKINISDEEARAYYEQHRQEFTSPVEITLREILLEVPTSDQGVNVAQDDAERATAEDVRKRALAGEPFPRLAGEYSAAASKANGGLIGPINSEELAPQLREMLSAMKVGDVSGVLRAQRGYQILKLESRTDAKVKTFDEARGDIGNKIGEQKLRGEREKYLDRLRAQATITWRNAELQKAYETALARRNQESGSKPQTSAAN
ncbi:MAG TPA: peptidyl-prolyl cis-trans isomerase [Vicinamibacterales bacterium]|nr:peptidyl-prolyl cis-trans isomerase [Vicinamibacterales bacterium]